MRQPINNQAVSRLTKTEENRRRAAILRVKPLPWRGLRGLGLRLKPILMKKGLGLMEDLRAYALKRKVTILKFQFNETRNT